jgi:hypothetical protein
LPGEQAALRLADALSYLDRLSKALNRASKLLTADSAMPMGLQNTVNSHIQSACQTIGLGSSMVSVVAGSLTVLNIVRERLESGSRSSGFVEGDQWKHLIWRLIDIAERHNLPTEITAPSSNEQKKRSPKSSIFVAFVLILQTFWPEQFRRHQSVAGLARAMKEVRKRRAHFCRGT